MSTSAFRRCLLLAFLPGAFRLASMIQEEKSNKLTDVLLSTVLPSHLLDGKFWGTTLSSLTAVFVWIVMMGGTCRTIFLAQT